MDQMLSSTTSSAVQTIADMTQNEGQNAVAAAAKNISQGVVQETHTMLHLDELKAYLTWGNLMKVVTSVVAIIIFYILYRIIKKMVSKSAQKRFQPHTVMIINKFVSYLFYIIIVMYILSLFGIKLSAVWGAAGIAGVAIGFAAQTSMSNLISGLFVIGEHTMKIGDFISVGGVSGTVDSIGFLSVIVHTLDNQVVRIPNSTIINSNLENFSSKPTRRLVFQVGLDYSTDMKKALVVMSRIAARCPTVLKDPAPSVYYTGFGNSSINMEVAVWFKSEDILKTKNDVYTAIMDICTEEKISIPFCRYDVNIINQKPAAKTVEKAPVKKAIKVASKKSSAKK
jgi:small-conductance mechanosensitive channel